MTRLSQKRARGGKETGFPGDDLLSHPVSGAVPSALGSLTAGFGMGPGVPSPPRSPEKPVVPHYPQMAPLGTLKTEQNAAPHNSSHSIKPSTISTALLRTLLPVHMPPIHLVVFQGSYLVT